MQAFANQDHHHGIIPIWFFQKTLRTEQQTKSEKPLHFKDSSLYFLISSYYLSFLLADMIASAIPTPSKLKTWHFLLLPPNTNIQPFPTRTTVYKRSIISAYSKFSHQSFNLFWKSNTRPILATRVSNGDDGVFDSASQYTSTSPSVRY